MNKASKLPDFIDVANIRDLFWNNNSDMYPACVPTGYHRVEQTRPVFLTPYVGTCVLDGELNHCIYNGEYYFLSKLEVLDIEKLRYKYQLDYDVMINFMVRGVDVTGTLIKTNRQDILEGCLQTTVPILADPINKRVYGKPIDSKETWQQKLKVDLFSLDTIRKNFEEWTITKENYQAFIHRIENNILGQGTKDKRWLAGVDTGSFNEHTHQNPLFILDSLPIDRTFNKWKLLLAYDIAKFFEDTNREDLIITKQVTPSDHFNHSGYVIGKKDATIGQNIVSEFTLSRIDLTGLTDIVPVENTSRMDMVPSRRPTYDMLPHSNKIAPPPNICVLLRKPYLPIGSDNSLDGCIPSPGVGVTDYCEIGLLGGNNTPQKIITQDNRTGYLWYLNKNNLALIDEDDSNLKNIGCKFSTSTWTGAYARWGFFKAQYKNIAPIGFLIYQLRKLNTEWDDIEHIGEGVTTLFFRTGLKQSVINKRYVVDADKHWWGHADEQLLQLWGDSELSKVQLDLDQFNWLSIAPSDSGYSYKYHYGNYWNYKKFFPAAGDRQIGYPSTLNRMNIEFNGKEIVNPYSYDDPDSALPGWLGERERKLASISTYDRVEVESGIRKGDIVTTSLEHGWYNMDELTRLLFPYDISTAEWMEWVSRDYGGTINLGEDEYAEFRSEQTKITAVGAVTVSIGILAMLLAPFTVGGSLAIAVAAAPGIVALGTGSAVLASQPSYSIQFKSSVVSTLPYSNPRYEVDPDIRDGTIVLYLYRGKYQVGVYKKKNISLSLDDDDNLIKTVDGKTNRDLDLMLIRPLEHGLLDYKVAPVVSDTLKQEIIEVGLGNRDSLTPLNKTHHYSKEDLKVGTHTFDLRGTDWYLVVHNGTMNFVPKDASKVFDTIKDEGQLIDIKDDVSTYAKINQKADLNYYGQVFQLNTKFTFDGQFRYISKPIVPDKEYADPGVEYKWLLVKEPNDDIDEILTLPRKETRHAEVVDSSQVLMMKERLLQISSNYEQDKYANELMVGDKKLLMARQREDLNWMHTSSSVNLGLKSFGALVGGTLLKKDPLLSVGAAATLVGSMKSDIEFLLKYPTLMKRVDEDEKNLMLANSQSLYQRKQNYEHDFKYQTLKLNKIAGTYQKAGVSNRDVQEKYNKERGVSDVNVEVFLPSPTQQRQIDYIYDTFGCECISDHFEYTPLSIRDNMQSGIYQFSRIESGGIQSSITDTILREILRRILENGVKFTSCAFEIEPLETKPIHVIVPRSPKIVFDPANIKDWSIEKWDTYKIKTDRKEIIDTLKSVPHFGLSDDEWDKHKDLFKEIKDDDLLDLLGRIIADREAGETVIIALPKETDPEKEGLNKTITDLREMLKQQKQGHSDELNRVRAELDTTKGTVAKLQAELDQCNEGSNASKDELGSLKAEYESAKKRLEEEIRQHKVDKEDLTQQLNNERVRAINEKDEINRLKKELEDSKGDKDRIGQLQEDIKKLELDKSTVQEQLDKCKVDLAKAKKDRPKQPAKPQPDIDCNLLRNIMNDPYTYDLKPRDNGWNAFLDLVFELAQSLKWEGVTHIDQRLISVAEVRPILQKLEELKNVPIIDRAMDIVTNPSWPKYSKWVTQGGSRDSDIDSIVSLVSNIKDLETPPTIHQVKSILDELNWLTFKAKGQLVDKVKSNSDLQTLFHHIYPGKSIELYELLYGDPKWGIIRKRVTDELQCVADGGSTIAEFIDGLNRTTTFNIVDITKPVTKGVQVFNTASIDVYDTAPHRQVINLIPNFYQAKTGKRTRDSKADWEWIINNYIYNRRVEIDGETKYYNLVWVKMNTGNVIYGDMYFAIRGFIRGMWLDHVIGEVEYYWKHRRGSVEVTPDMVRSVKTGRKPLILRFESIVNGVDNAVKYDYTVPQNLIDQLSSAGYLTDFMRMVLLFKSYYYIWYLVGRDKTDNYRTYFKGGDLDCNDEPRSDGTPFMDAKTLSKCLGKPIHLGWLFPMEYIYDEDRKLWVNVDGSTSSRPSYSGGAAAYRFIRFFLEVMAGKREFTHPWKVNAGGAYAFMKAMADIHTAASQ